MDCYAIATRIDGQCGSAHKKSYPNYPYDAPSGAVLCDAGSASMVNTRRDDNYSWSCYGKNNGSTASCYAIIPKNDGKC